MNLNKVFKREEMEKTHLNAINKMARHRGTYLELSMSWHTSSVAPSWPNITQVGVLVDMLKKKRKKKRRGDKERKDRASTVNLSPNVHYNSRCFNRATIYKSATS
jgi:hypothetical protein